MIKIQQHYLTAATKKFIFDGFAKHNISHLGFDGLGREQISFEAYDDNIVIGAGSVLTFFGALWIKYLFVTENYRGKGVGNQLMTSMLNFGKSEKLSFAH